MKLSADFDIINLAELGSACALSFQPFLRHILFERSLTLVAWQFSFFSCQNLISYGEPDGKYFVRGVYVDTGFFGEWTWCLGMLAKSFFCFSLAFLSFASLGL